MEGLTTFEIETDSIGTKVVKRLDGKTVKESYALNRPHAEFIRQIWVNEFWGNEINTNINQLCCQ